MAANWQQLGPSSTDRLGQKWESGKGLDLRDDIGLHAWPTSLLAFSAVLLPLLPDEPVVQQKE